MSSPTMDDVLVRALDTVIERRIQEIAKAGQPRMLSARRAAAYLDICVDHLDELVRQGKIPEPIRYVDHAKAQRYFEREWLDRFIEERRAAA